MIIKVLPGEEVKSRYRLSELRMRGLIRGTTLACPLGSHHINTLSDLTLDMTGKALELANQPHLKDYSQQITSHRCMRDKIKWSNQ